MKKKTNFFLLLPPRALSMKTMIMSEEKKEVHYFALQLINKTVAQTTKNDAQFCVSECNHHYNLWEVPNKQIKRNFVLHRNFMLAAFLKNKYEFCSDP